MSDVVGFITVTKKQRQILEILSFSKVALSPTQIGMMARRPYASASGWALPALKKLVERGLVNRVVGEKIRVVKYEIILEIEGKS